MKQEERVLNSCSKIVETAITVFGKKGYKATTTNEICEACGISKGLVFYHFKSKEALFTECAKLCIDRLDKYMKDNFVKGSSPMEGVSNCCLVRKNFFMENPYYNRIFGEVLYEKDESNSQKHRELLKRYKQYTYEIIYKLLEGVGLKSGIQREMGIRSILMMMEAIDSDIWNRGFNLEETERMLDEQMNNYEVFIEILLYGILDPKEPIETL